MGRECRLPNPIKLIPKVTIAGIYHYQLKAELRCKHGRTNENAKDGIGSGISAYTFNCRLEP